MLDNLAKVNDHTIKVVCYLHQLFSRQSEKLAQSSNC